MTKQEEIRIGISGKIHSGWLCNMGEVDTAKMIMQYLHSQGVVILASDVPIERCSFVEPLIKEDNMCEKCGCKCPCDCGCDCCKK